MELLELAHFSNKFMFAVSGGCVCPQKGENPATEWTECTNGLLSKVMHL